MKRRLALTLSLVGSILVMGLAPVAAAPAAQAAEMALLRLVHAVPQAPGVDVMVDGALAATQLTFADYTGYLRVAAGDHSISVQAGGSTITETSLTINPGQAITAIVMGPAEAPAVQIVEDDLGPLVLGNVRLTATHTVSGSDAVDVVLADGTPVFQALAYGNSSGGIDIPANSYPLAVTPTGGTVAAAIVPAEEFHLRAGNFYRVVVLGGPDALLLESPANPAEDSVFVRVAHAIPEAPTVDVYANEVLLIPALEALSITGPIALPLGSYDLAIRASGTGGSEPPIASLTVDLSDAALAGQARTVAAVMTGAAIDLQVFEDDFSELAAGDARFAVANAVPASNLIAELDNGTEIAAGEAFTSPPATSTTAGVYELLIASDGGGSFTTDGAFDGGVLYSYLVTGTPDALVVIESTVALNQQPGSVIATAMAAAPEPTTDTEVVEVVTEPVVEPTQVPAAPPPTAVPAQPVQPGAAPGEGLLGQVYNLNPGANLQLRQYPRSDALSLGLVSGGTLVTVLGRAGEPDFENLPMLAPDEAMDPTQTWLKVSFETPDGGTIIAWVLAQYIQVTEDGERVPLIDIEPLPSNVPGEVSGTSVAAPSASPVNADFYGVVFNINPDANLNIRRTPEVLGEVLVRLPPGTIVEPTGVLQDQTWVFLTYRAEDGGVITGWASSEFIQFVFRGTNYLPNPERFSELLQRGLLEITDADVRGTVSAGTAPSVGGGSTDVSQFRNQYVGTTDLDPDTNLHLRRTPDAAGESLALIPNGGVMIVIGRTSDAEWLQVTYDDIDGWVASAFVDIQLNGRPVELMDVPAIR